MKFEQQEINELANTISDRLVPGLLDCIELLIKENFTNPFSVSPKQKLSYTTKETSELTGIAVSTLEHNRFNRVGIPYIKIGKSIRYKHDDIVKYIEEHRINIKRGVQHERIS